MRKISEDNLKKGTEHINYEIQMFRETLILLTQSTNQITINTLLDSFTVHARNLFYFLYPSKNKRKDDILVTDYIDEKKCFDKCKTKESKLSYIPEKTSKQVAHLSYKRSEYDKETKPWLFVDIAIKMNKTLLAFYRSLSGEKKKWQGFLSLKQEISSLDLFLSELKGTLEKAIRIATKAHTGQTDKAGKAYILHPLRLMMRMNLVNEQIVAILHDVVEDSDYTFDDLKKEGFDGKIIGALQSLTKRSGEDYEDFIIRVKQNKLATIVKIADLKDNSDLNRISTPTKEDLERVEKYKDALNTLEES